jgi:hypothetical protein
MGEVKEDKVEDYAVGCCCHVERRYCCHGDKDNNISTEPVPLASLDTYLFMSMTILTVSDLFLIA